MATQLKESDDSLTVEKVEFQGLRYNLDSTTQIDIDEQGDAGFPVPQRIIVRTLDFIAGGNGPIGWVRPDRPHPCNSLADVAQMVAAVRPGGGYNPLPDAVPYHRPLDLNLRIPTCFIIKLGSGANWRFSHKAKGATLGPAVATNPANYCNLRHVLDDGTEQYDEFDHPANCRILYFFARPPAVNPTPNFQNSFNLNVELLYGGGPANEINSIPIVIDPDIRFPGGSED